jgi:hypothetical protein
MGAIRILAVVLAVAVSVSASASQKVDLSRAKVVVLNPQKKIEANAADMVRDEVEKRTRIGLDVVSKMPGADEVVILIGTAGELAEKSYRPPASFEVPSKTDAYSVWIDTSKRRAATICAAGHDDRGTLYAVGRLLRLLEMGRDKVRLDSDIRVATAPRYSLRGHQLGYRPKTNSYDAWTLPMWEQYYRDMVVFGMNALELIPPKSDDDDDSPHLPKRKIEMMIDMSQLADDYGLEVWIWWPAIDGDYSDRKVVESGLKDRDDVLKQLPRVDVVFVPGGDPGKTHPKILLPFMEKHKQVVNRYQAFFDILQTEEPKWLDGIVFGPQVETTLANLRKEVPGRYPIRRYPDITHCRSSQYAVPNWDRACRTTVGREPINPRPVAYTKIFRDLQQYAIGYITYSEGCNDDFNKVLWSCLGWDPDMKTEDIAVEYSRYFISPRYAKKFAQGLFGLERNWVGALKDNDGVYETLKLFQEMEKRATPQEKLNWRFQQGLYRAYYDAYVKARLHYETELEQQAKDVLKTAGQIGSLAAMDKAEDILDKTVTEKVRPEWRARAFEMAEALYQSIRMQLSVKKYQAIRINRGANLDEIDKPLNDREDLKKDFKRIRGLSSEKERLDAIAALLR